MTDRSRPKAAPATTGQGVETSVRRVGDLARKEHQRRLRQLQLDLARLQFRRHMATRDREAS